MKRISTFIFGMIVGGILLYVVLFYHVIRAEDGLHFIPKVSAQFGSTYLDIRDLTLADLRDNAAVVEAIFRADKQHILKGTANNLIDNGLDKIFGVEDSN